MEALAWICLFTPLAGVVLLALASTRISRTTAAWAGTAFAAISFVAAAGVFVRMLGHNASDRSSTYTLYTWATSGSFKIPLAIQVDQLSVTEMLIVSGVGALIVLYSIGYLHGDPKERRFFAYLNMFLFSMLLLVMSANFALLLAGWGLVGLSSYLLIGFWYERPEPVQAAKKAFVMNAIGDVGIAIAVFFMVRDAGTTDFSVMLSSHQPWSHGSTDANLVALGLLVGAIAKSAQLPLQTWLPDAMEGPTPVSALIHAATMVTAGVYLVARTHVIFENAPTVHNMVAILGLATLLMAGVIAMVQTDIKRIIAYSTMSQIGYMFTAVGVGAYSQGMYLLLAHAFFKALLFLGAGVVIHAMSNEQDVRKMGGLGSALPKTKWLMWIGTGALIGFFPLSKDEILAAGLDQGSALAIAVWAGGLIGAFFTGMYAVRLMRLTFYGERSEFAKEHLHTDHGEGPWMMVYVVAALAVGVVLVGFLDLGFGTVDHFGEWLASTAPSAPTTVTDDLITTAISWSFGIGGGLLVWWTYADPRRLARIKGSFREVASIAEHKFYFDELYDRIGYDTFAALATYLYAWFERYVIWGSIAALTYVVRRIASGVALAQTGIVRSYAATLVAGGAVLAVYFLTRASL